MEKIIEIKNLSKAFGEAKALDIIKEVTDCKTFFFDKEVDMPTMYAIIVGSILLLIAGYICSNAIRNRRKAG